MKVEEEGGHSPSLHQASKSSEKTGPTLGAKMMWGHERTVEKESLRHVWCKKVLLLEHRDGPWAGRAVLLLHEADDYVLSGGEARAGSIRSWMPSLNFYS